MDGTCTHIGKTRNAYTIFAGKPRGRCHFADLGIDGKLRV
jgi:hypothetical protein